MYWNAADTRGSLYHLEPAGAGARRRAPATPGDARRSSPLRGRADAGLGDPDRSRSCSPCAPARARGRRPVAPADVAVPGPDRRTQAISARDVVDEFRDRGRHRPALVEAGQLAEHELLVAGAASSPPSARAPSRRRAGPPRTGGRVALHPLRRDEERVVGFVPRAPVRARRRLPGPRRSRARRIACRSAIPSRRRARASRRAVPLAATGGPCRPFRGPADHDERGPAALALARGQRLELVAQPAVGGARLLVAQATAVEAVEHRLPLSGSIDGQSITSR